jgi:hypothetical protein
MIIRKVLQTCVGYAFPLALLAGCSGGSNAPIMDAAAGAGGDAALPRFDSDEVPAKPSCADRASQVLSVNQKFYHSGFEVTLGDATYTAASSGCHGEVAIAASFYNRGGANAELGARMLLTSGAKDYDSTPTQDDQRLVPGQRTGKGFLRFAVDEEFDIRAATLLVGDAGEHTAVVPIGADSPDELLTLEPADITLTDSATAGSLTFKMDGGYIHADLPSRHETLAKKYLELVLHFSVSAESQENISGDNFTLVLPDGTAVAPDAAPIELTRSGTTIDNLAVVFRIDAPAEGKYAFQLGGMWGDRYAWVETEVPFQLAKQPQFDAP